MAIRRSCCVRAYSKEQLGECSICTFKDGAVGASDNFVMRACVMTTSVMEKSCKVRKVTDKDIRHGFE